MADQNWKITLGDKEVHFLNKNWAEQADGNILVRAGDTLVLVTAVMGPETSLGFFPLFVDYEERFYAAGKILGSRFVRREGKPSDEAVIAARLIDRAIRPLFPKNLKREVQVVATTLSWDGQNDPDVLGLLGTSLALSLSDIPWQGPIAGMRVGKIGDKFVVNPTYEERSQSSTDFLVAATREGKDLLVNMIEAESQEVDEKTFQEALAFAEPLLNQIIDFQLSLQKEHGKEKAQVAEPEKNEVLGKEISELLGTKLQDALFQGDRQLRMTKVDEVRKETIEALKERHPEEDVSRFANDFIEEEIDRLVHEGALNGRRVDDRKPEEIRSLAGEVGVLPRTHGSALFSRGQTRTLSILTLGGPADHKLLEGMEMSGKKRFMHHYNFPPYAPGETKPMRGPGRREIGHGMLAEKALLPIIPDFDQFPYTIRIVSEVVSSNGSTSMASTCSSMLALLDAGVPVPRPVAGISVGLMTGQDGRYTLITDIQGPEDHYGDMDFKVAGSKEGITAIQLDVKIKGITAKQFRETLEVAKKARHTIIDEVFNPLLPEPRPELSKYAPRVSIIKIDPEKIGMVIGPGGKVINRMIADYGVKIDIDDTGEVYVTAENGEGDVEGAIANIKGIVKEVEVGEIYQGTVRRITDFGAFVEILPGQDGLVHISQLAPQRIEKVTDIAKVGDKMPVKVIKIDEQGRIDLSRKEALDHLK